MEDWVCAQWSGREKYAIPRALFSRHRLKRMYTDLWIKPGSLLELLKKAKGRYHPALSQGTVMNFNSTFLALQLAGKIKLPISAMDDVFDHRVAALLRKDSSGEGQTFFGYSYSSRNSMKEAQGKKYRTILGQINPGPLEAALVREEYARYKNGRYKPFVPDEKYWQKWKEEIASSDKIIVNSEWSRKLLVEAGVDDKRCVIVPLSYEGKAHGNRQYEEGTFTPQHPMHILYLGAVSLRKGFHLLKEAMSQLTHAPIHLDVVGVLKGPDELLSSLPKNITYHGAVSPHEVDQFYTKATIFMFPTLSDGFGLTQLEAQSYRLPLITSVFCGHVIQDHVNGLVMDKVSAKNIRLAIEEILDQPELLNKFRSGSIDMEEYSLEKLASCLIRI